MEKIYQGQNWSYEEFFWERKHKIVKLILQFTKKKKVGLTKGFREHRQMV